MAVAVAAMVSSVALAQTATPPSLLRPLAGAEVDWSAGTVTASAGAAADMRMPSPDAARPGAERRARAAAVEKLRAALRALCVRGRERLGEKAVETALAHASAVRTEYQSNGGVVLWLGVRFNQIGAVAREPVAATGALAAFSVHSMPLELAPLVVLGGKEMAVPHAQYRQERPPADAIKVRRDDQGRLVLPAGGEGMLDRLAERPVVIYLEKVLP